MLFDTAWSTRQIASIASDRADAGAITIVTFHVMMDLLEHPAVPPWERRKEACVEMLRAAGADAIALQEASPAQQAFIAAGPRHGSAAGGSGPPASTTSSTDRKRYSPRTGGSFPAVCRAFGCPITSPCRFDSRERPSKSGLSTASCRSSMSGRSTPIGIGRAFANDDGFERERFQ